MDGIFAEDKEETWNIHLSLVGHLVGNDGTALGLLELSIDGRPEFIMNLASSILIYLIDFDSQENQDPSC